MCARVRAVTLVRGRFYTPVFVGEEEGYVRGVRLSFCPCTSTPILDRERERDLALAGLE